MTVQSERRAKARRRTLKTARLAFNSKGSSVNCVQRNRSETGAGVRLDGPAALPDKVQLVVENEIIDSRRVWQAGLNVGLEFTPPPAGPPAPGEKP